MNALITGASIGIGANLAIKLAQKGYNLYLTYYNNEILCKQLQKEIMDKYQVKCFITRCDLKAEKDILKVKTDFYNKLKTLDLLVNNASISCDNLLISKTKEEFKEVLEVNILGTFLITKHLSTLMPKNSIIINMASTDGIDTYSIYNIDYAVSKAGIIQLTKSFSLILNNIKSIAIAPNWVATPSTIKMNRDYLKTELKRLKQNRLISIDTVTNKIIQVINDKNIKSGEVITIYE